MTVFFDYYERYDHLKFYLSNELFSDLSGINWIRKCSELFPTVRLHIAKLSLFSPVGDKYIFDHWKHEIMWNMQKMLDFKKAGWRPDAEFFMSKVKDWLPSFDDIRILSLVNMDEYDDYRERLINYYGLTQKNYERRFLELLEESDSKCDEVFTFCMKSFVDILQNKSVNTKKKLPFEIMSAISDDIESKLNELTASRDD